MKRAARSRWQNRALRANELLEPLLAYTGLEPSLCYMSETNQETRGDDTAHKHSHLGRDLIAPRTNAETNPAATSAHAQTSTTSPAAGSSGLSSPLPSPFGQAQPVAVEHHTADTAVQPAPVSVAERWQRASRQVTEKGRIRFSNEPDPQTSHETEGEAPNLQRPSMASQMQSSLSKISSTLSLSKLVSNKENKDAGAAFAEVVKAANAQTRQQLDSAAPAMRAVPSTKV